MRIDNTSRGVAASAPSSDMDVMYGTLAGCMHVTDDLLEARELRSRSL